MNDMVLKAGRIFLVIGIIGVGASVFLSNYGGALLTTSNAKLQDFEKMKEERYYVERPEKPIDISDYLVPPIKPATKEEKEIYNQQLKNYNEEKKRLREDYKKELAEYEKQIREYNHKVKEMKFRMKKEEADLRNMKKNLLKNVQKYRNSSNYKVIPLYLRYAGAALLLFGALLILLMGEVQEKLGILVLLGFAFRWIVGL